MMQQSREPFSLPSSRCLSHTCQSLGHAFLPSLCRVRAGLTDVLLSLHPSLPSLRIRTFFHLFSFVRLVHRYYAAVRPLRFVRACRTAIAFTSRSVPLSWADISEVSRFSCMK